jgi:hypothetical protein
MGQVLHGGGGVTYQPEKPEEFAYILNRIRTTAKGGYYHNIVGMLLYSMEKHSVADRNALVRELNLEKIGFTEVQP